jgi:hypothetical protein
MQTIIVIIFLSYKFIFVDLTYIPLSVFDIFKSVLKNKKYNMVYQRLGYDFIHWINFKNSEGNDFFNSHLQENVYFRYAPSYCEH